MREWRARAVGAALVVIGVLGLGMHPAQAACEAEPCAPAAADASQDQAGAVQLLALANVDRAAAGVAPLAARDDVAAIAIDFSKQLAAVGELSHNDAYFTAATRNRLDAKALAENVAMNRDVADAHRRLMASPGHRANLLDARFSVVGIGVIRDSNGIAYITQDFLQPRTVTGAVVATPSPEPAAPTPAPAPRSVRKPAATAGPAAPPRPAAAPSVRPTEAAPPIDVPAAWLEGTEPTPAPDAETELASGTSHGPISEPSREVPGLAVVIAFFALVASLIFLARSRLTRLPA